MASVFDQLADAFTRRKLALAEKDKPKTKLAGSDYFMPKSSKEDLAQQQRILDVEGLPGVLKEGASQMYHNPIVNTAISLTPGAGDVQSGYEAVQSAKEGKWGEAGLNALGVLPFVPALGGMTKLAKGAEEVATDYRMAHTAPNREFGAQLHDLSAIYPEDIYSPNAARYYGGGGDTTWRQMDNNSVRIAQSFRGKPDADVTIYRAAPKDEKITAINPGDWVTINKDYARTHGESNLPEGYKIISQKVKAKDIWTNADSVHEYGYDPQL